MKLKAVSGILVTVLLIGVLTLAFKVQPVKAEPPLPYFSLNPMRYTAFVGETFTVDVNITDVTGMQGFEFKLWYNKNVVNATGVTTGPVVDPSAIKGPVGPAPGYYWSPHNCTGCVSNGYVWCVIANSRDNAFTGSGILVTVHFTALAPGASTLQLDETILADSLAQPIAHYTIDGSITVIGAHGLAVTLEAPAFLEPEDSSLLSATVYNIGLSNETDVELFLLINGTEVNHVTIPELANGTSYTIDYLWTPTVEGIYNLTAYAPPVPGENFTANNWYTRRARVESLPVISLNPMRYTAFVGETFTVDVNITDVTGMQGFEFKLWYNKTVVNATGVTTGSQVVDAGAVKGPVGPAPGYIWSPHNCTNCLAKGYVWVVIANPLGKAFTGSGILVTVNLTAKIEGTCNLYINETTLGDSSGLPITHDIWPHSPQPQGIVVVVPEFPVTMFMALLLIATLAATIIGKMVWSRKRKDAPIAE